MVALEPGSHQLGDTVFDVDLVDEVCRVVPLGTWGAIFRPDADLVARTSRRPGRRGRGRRRTGLGAGGASVPGRLV